VSALPDEPDLPAAVLWDMDGTLVDTEPYWFAAEREIVAEHGGEWSDEHAHALIGKPLLVSAEYIRAYGNVDLPAEQIVEQMLDRVMADVRRRIPWRPGARELLDEVVGEGVPCALVTMSWTQLADAVTEQLPPRTFAAVVTGDQVRHGKPHPEPYLTAVERLGLRPEDCLAIEDSPTGTASAVAAGVPVVAVPSVVPVPAGPGHVVVRTLEGRGAAELYALALAHRGTHPRT
jgi:HAD superfamily hydrolase (TIGR01509 family)